MATLAQRVGATSKGVWRPWSGRPNGVFLPSALRSPSARTSATCSATTLRNPRACRCRCGDRGGAGDRLVRTASDVHGLWWPQSVDGPAAVAPQGGGPGSRTAGGSACHGSPHSSWSRRAAKGPSRHDRSRRLDVRAVNSAPSGLSRVAACQAAESCSRSPLCRKDLRWEWASRTTSDDPVKGPSAVSDLAAQAAA